MRLKKIEVVGFKSFADRQVIVVDDHVTAVIGPNGCGKSNIVDAVRWCMGEQSAKHLRGAGMADVIFAGCASRGPAGMAEVTLTFENDGRAPVAHLDMPEIAITRRLFSDGTSEYLINKVPARLRDITDVLMGTGAGTKGYAIIEQGQVGKIVTSKPEERRHIIDEAAGITRFKAQKAAAERKIEGTRANLMRVRDVVVELDTRLSTLRRQAQKAERYRRYRDELRELELRIASHRFLELLATGSVLATRREDLAARVDDLKHSIASRDAQISAGRLELAEVEQELSTLQQTVYDLDNRIRLSEAEEEYRVRERQGLGHSAVAARAEAEAGERGLVGVQEELAHAEEERDRLGDGSGLGGARARAEALELAVQTIGTALATDRARLAEITEACGRDERELATTVARSSAVVEAVADLQARAERSADAMIEAQHAAVSATDAQAERELEHEARASVVVERRTQRAALERDRAALRERVAAAEVELDTQRAEVHRCRSRLQSLQEIQRRYRACASGVQVVMEHREELEASVLDASGVATGSGGGSGSSAVVFGVLADHVQAPAHLEAAVSAVLGDRLEGIVVDAPAVAARGVELLKRLQEGRTTFLPRQVGVGPGNTRDSLRGDPAGGARAGLRAGWADPLSVGGIGVREGIEVVDLSEAGPESGSRGLSGRIEGPGVVGRLRDLVSLGDRLVGLADVLLGDTWVIDDLPHALELWRTRPGELSLVTLDGDRIEPSGVVIGGSPTSLDSALLKQKREIGELEAILLEVSDAFESTRGRHLALAQQLAEVERAREANEVATLEVEKATVAAHSDLTAAIATAERTRAHVLDLVRQGEDLATQIDARQIEIAGLHTHRAELGQRLDAGRVEEAELTQRTAAAQDELAAHAAELTEAKVAHARFQQQLDTLRGAIDRLRRQIASERDRIARLRDTAQQADERAAELARAGIEAAAERAALVTRSREATGRVHDVRERHDALRLRVGETEASVRTLRVDLDGERERLQEVELGLQEIGLERTHLLADTRRRFDVRIHDVLVDHHDRAPLGPEGRERHRELERILSRMGEVNLTAIEEFDEVSKRFEYLSSQQKDLESAIEQLQEAIDRINKTTRQLFRDAFTAIDERFQQLFPRLFNGGRARLRLTDPTDMLGTGVEIEAQPPGKQLRSLELLSGGEKALTAVSLIFAVFLYKPSPFCLLDEVDAPLDDVNVGRMNKLIRELAADTQFIVITHNKVSMEGSDRLYGVTMEQRGISKLVSVNMRRAVELAYN